MKSLARRHVIAGMAGVFAASLAAGHTLPALAGGTHLPEPEFDFLVALERRVGGRLGAAFLNGTSGAIVGHRLDERFTMCSTFKLSLAAAVLARIDAGTLHGTLPVPITERDVIGHSPAVKAALSQGALSILALAEAAQTQSDNGAANLLLRQIGGPEALTRFWYGLGDEVSRLDRYEPDLNTSHGEDYRDTSSPAAMAHSMAAILTGPVLSPASRQRLIRWMVATTTGASRLRAGLPSGWRAGDKTGTMSADDSPLIKVNDIAATWRPDGTPFFITAFYEPNPGTPVVEAEKALAEVGQIAARWLQP
ncbi:MAG TPA: class A beta-lactamase [Sphingobium sp.]|uniref:class A beta-lactamase n=1 Tax=Sphingobium sp. TaxID=1912891 RepID=UPI002ED5C5E3